MSYQASDWAMAQRVDNPSAKLVLLVLAHHLNTKTGRCFPSIATIARETGLSDRGIRNAIARLVQQGLVELRGSTTRRHYHLNVAAPAPGADVSRETPAPDAASKVPAPAHAAATAANAAGHSGTPCRLTCKEHANNREGESALPPDVIGNAKTKAARLPGKGPIQATRLQADWQPSPDGVAHAQREHPDLDWQRELRAFRDYWVAKPNGESADWEASWRRWLAQAERFAPKPKGKLDRGKPDPEPDQPRPTEEQVWTRRLQLHRKDGFWVGETWGPKPGEPSCFAPAHILRQFGYSVWQRDQPATPPTTPIASGDKAPH